MKNLIKACLIILIIGTYSCAKDGEMGPAGADGAQGISGVNGTNGTNGVDGEDATINVTMSTADVYSPMTSEVSGSSTLYRTEDTITATLESTGLIAGHAYTLWVLVFNQPENCGGSPCALSDLKNVPAKAEMLGGSGLVADVNGKGIFSCNIRENDGTTSINDRLGMPIDVGGIWDAQTVEVHLIVRSHGPAIMGHVIDQITSYGGGCTTFLKPPFSAVPMLDGECVEVLASIHKI
ncbi:MAG: hypothetical protein V3U92_12605 [Cellulophaga sp.]